MFGIKMKESECKELSQSEDGTLGCGVPSWI